MVQNTAEVQKQLRNVQHIQATLGAFAAILETGAVVTWGRADRESSQVQEKLMNVQHIQATGQALAAILESGAIVTWGRADCGGDSNQVQEQLRNVQHIQATGQALAAILESGAVDTLVETTARCKSRASAAILESGAVVARGRAEWGGGSSQVQEQPRNVQHIQATAGAFFDMG